MVVMRNRGERKPVEANNRLTAIGSVLLSKFQRFEKTDQSLHDHYTWIDGDLTFTAANTRGKGDARLWICSGASIRRVLQVDKSATSWR
jgi:hypothetical protein